jgi:hypothetical protein
MKKNIIKIMACATVISGFLFLSSCNQDNDGGPLLNNKNNTSVNALYSFYKNNALKIQKFTINVDGTNENTITGAGGIKIIFPAGCFVDYMGQPLTGSFDVSLKEVITKADMILGKINMFSHDSVIVSSGMVYLDARKNGIRPMINPYKPIEMQVAQVGAQRNDFMTFNGLNDGQDSSNWSPWGDSTNLRGARPIHNSYSLLSSKFGWINCDRFYGESNLVKFDVKLPAEYGNSNATVHIIFTNDHTVINMYGNLTSKTFDLGSYSGVPAGRQVKILVISSVGEQLKYAVKDYVTAAGTVTFSELNNTTEAELKTYLNGL